MLPPISNFSSPALSLYFTAASPISAISTVTVCHPASAESNVFLAVKPVPSLSLISFVPSVNVKSIGIVPPSVVPS